MKQAKISSRARAVQKNAELMARPSDQGGIAKWYGVIPRYMNGGFWNPSKKRQKNRA